MSYPDRLFPQTITPGDDLIFSHRRPEIPGYTSGTQDVRDTDEYEAIFTDTSTGLEQTFDATLNAYRDGTSEILIYQFAISTDDWPARPYYLENQGKLATRRRNEVPNLPAGTDFRPR